MTGAATSGGARSLNAPPKRPIADRTADTTNTSGMEGNLHEDARRQTPTVRGAGGLIVAEDKDVSRPKSQAQDVSVESRACRIRDRRSWAGHQGVGARHDETGFD